MSTYSSGDDTSHESDDESLDSSHDSYVEPVITKAMDSDRRIENDPSAEENPWGSGFNFHKSRSRSQKLDDCHNVIWNPMRQAGLLK